VKDEIRRWVESEVGTVTDVAPIGSGASREIWRVDTAEGPWVVRVDTGTGPVAGTALDLTREAVVYGALDGSGLPVPRLRAVEPKGRALLMDLVGGEDGLAGVGDDERRAAIGRDYLGWLGRLHLLDVDGLHLPGWPRPASAVDHARLDLELWSTICTERAGRWTGPSTPFALDWLRAHAPSTVSRTSLCHGDAGPGNFLFAGDEVSALLDWEFAHLGDPHDDLAWVAVRNHLLGRPIDLVDAFGRWRDVTGLAVEPERLEYYRVLVLVRMAISCDATIAWKDGVEDDSIRTQALLRPWLGVAITTALAFAGCDGPELDPVRGAAEDALAASPHAALLAMIPALELLEAP
jgi:aminoglycoside phosphotransferase (APT) family kinase protein